MDHVGIKLITLACAIVAVIFGVIVALAYGSASTYYSGWKGTFGVILGVAVLIGMIWGAYKMLELGWKTDWDNVGKGSK